MSGGRDAAREIVETMRRVYERGMTTLSGGNISARDAEGSVWISPGGVDKGSLEPEDIVRVGIDSMPAGGRKPSSELPFHLAAYRARPGFGAILHAHPPALVAFSAARRAPDPRLVPELGNACGRVGYAPYALPGSEELGAAVAGVMADGADSVFLENHGVVIGGADLREAYRRFDALDLLARIELAARRIGKPRTAPVEDDVGELSASGSARLEAEDIPARDGLRAVAERAYARGICSVSTDIFSVRSREDAFIATRLGADIYDLDDSDFLRFPVDEGAENGIEDQRYRSLALFYARCPSARSIILARPAHAMGFACAGADLDSRILPEAYILLRSIPRVSAGAGEDVYARAVDSLSPSRPILLLENACVLASGKDVLEAYDRLEVAEFGARSIIEARSLGDLVPIEKRGIDDLISAFKLPR